MNMWKEVGSVALFIYRKAPELRFLLEQEGDMWIPPMAVVDGEAGHGPAAVRLSKELVPDGGVKLPVDLDLRVTYYARETKFVQRVFGGEAGGEADVVEGRSRRWTSFEEGLRLLTLTCHRKALVKLLSEVVDPEAPVAHPDPDEFYHVHVGHRSGTMVLCDFDGTVTEGEPSVSILKAFAPEAWEVYEKAWLSGELTTHECLGYQFTIIRAPKGELVQYSAENGVVRDGFADFVAWCRKMGHGLAITSMGIDFYIGAILERNGLSSVPFVANRAVWSREMGLVVEEGLVDQSCDECSNCKSMLVDQYKARGARVVFVGDGRTDRCPAERADLVFARGELLEHCRENGVAHVPFDGFDDVRKGLEV